MASEDVDAFNAVISAYKLPRDSEEEKDVRITAIQKALVDAAQAPIDTAFKAQQVVELAKNILDNTNKNVVSDIAVAAIMAKAALETSIVNVEINLASVKDPEWRAQAVRKLETIMASVADADDLIASVRERIKA